MNKLTLDCFYTNVSPFLYWDDYCNICNALKIRYNFHIYFKYCPDIPSINELLHNDREYVSLFKFLYKDEELKLVDLTILYEKGHINIIKFLETKIKINIYTYNNFIPQFHIKTIKYWINKYPSEINNLFSIIINNRDSDNHVIQYLLNKLNWKMNKNNIYYLIVNNHIDILIKYIKRGNQFLSIKHYSAALLNCKKYDSFKFIITNLHPKLKNDIIKFNKNNMFPINKFNKTRILLLLSLGYLDHKLILKLAVKLHRYNNCKFLLSQKVMKFVTYDIDYLVNKFINTIVKQTSTNTYDHFKLRNQNNLYRLLTDFSITRHRTFSPLLY